jgi:hypothetical protein
VSDRAWGLKVKKHDVLYKTIPYQVQSEMSDVFVLSMVHGLEDMHSMAAQQSASFLVGTHLTVRSLSLA